MATKRIGALDVFGLSIGWLGLAWAILWALKIGPTYAKMFSDFGSALPAITRVALLPWIGFVAPAVSLAIVGEGILRAATQKGRAVRLVFAVAIVGASTLTFWAAMYVPILSPASAIRDDP